MQSGSLVLDVVMVVYVWVSVMGIVWVLYKVMFGNAYVCACMRFLKRQQYVLLRHIF